MHWFSHLRRTTGRHNCITYLLSDAVAWPIAMPATPTSVCWCCAYSDSATTTFWGIGAQGWGLWPQIRTRARFLYNAPNHQLSSFYVGSYCADKQTELTDAAENIHLALLCNPGGYWVTIKSSSFKAVNYKWVEFAAFKKGSQMYNC